MTNILSLKNFIRLYRVTYDSKKRTACIVHREEFGHPDMVFDMHPCGLHVYYPEKNDGQYGFVQTVAENMMLFTKRQIDEALKARHLYETLGYPSNADFESVLRVGGIGGCSDTVEDAKVAQKIWGSSVPRLKGSTVRESGHRKKRVANHPGQPSLSYLTNEKGYNIPIKQLTIAWHCPPNLVS